jgi:hypothetical protein
MKNLVPPIGTMVPIRSGDASLSKDDKTYMCRITFDESTKTWIIASRFNQATGRWAPTTKHKRLGFIVFLNDKPDTDDTHVRISAIQPSGQGAYGDSIKQSTASES